MWQCVRKPLTCELWLKEYIYDKFSKCSARDLMNASTCLIMDRRIRSKMPGQCGCSGRHQVPLSCQKELHTRAFKFSRRYKSRGFKSGERGGHAVGPPLHIHRSWYVLLRTSRTKRLKYAGAPSCMYCISALTASGTASSSFGRSCKRKSW
jgi:hypothetical protein